MADTRFLLFAWWRDRVDYRAIVAAFESHAALGLTRFMIGIGGAVLLAMSLCMSASPGGFHGPVGKTVATITAVVAVYWTLRWWLFSWPSETESLVLIACADLVITVSALTVHNHVYGAIATATLIIPGGYLLFLGPRALILHVCWSVASVLAVTAMMVTDESTRSGGAAGDYAFGAALILGMVAATVVALPVSHFGHWLLRRDSLSDPLTKLWNRRALDTFLPRYFDAHHRGPVYVATLDMDRFKHINDEFGHAAGDEVLIRIANRVRAAADPDALVARAGGEEFVVAGYLRDDPASVLAERLRYAVETTPDLPVPVTASVGITVFLIPPSADPHPSHYALRCSDIAMYEAKRRGGNTVAVTQPDTAPQLPRLTTDA
ncbi:diguanylate cyclase domain-containing protein [Nocardia sp. NPDC049149]|uniref:GGDEF domain-containing protein n=1 Tax=Nocardia sp. NPDC049149 TaxID=3364315 RepID=UPI0037123D47